MRAHLLIAALALSCSGDPANDQDTMTDAGGTQVRMGTGGIVGTDMGIDAGTAGMPSTNPPTGSGGMAGMGMGGMAGMPSEPCMETTNTRDRVITVDATPDTHIGPNDANFRIMVTNNLCDEIRVRDYLKDAVGEPLRERGGFKIGTYEFRLRSRESKAIYVKATQSPSQTRVYFDIQINADPDPRGFDWGEWMTLPNVQRLFMVAP